MLINQLLENSAANYPEKVAVIYNASRITYNQLNSQADNLATSLIKEFGISKGDRVALLLENGIEYVISYYAVLKAGAVASPLNPGLKPVGLQGLLSDLEPAAIISSFKSERLLKAIPIEDSSLKCLIVSNPKQNWRDSSISVSTFEDCVAPKGRPAEIENAAPKDLASIIYTSGSTGTPKGVMLSHLNIVSNTNSICEYLCINQNDIQMVILPFFYVMGKSLLNTHIAAGATLVINNRFMYPADVVNQMIEERVTSFSGVPSTYAYLLNRSPLSKLKSQLISLRYCSQAGGHMAKSLKLALRRALPDHSELIIMYGATEAAARLTYVPPDLLGTKLDSIGKPIPGVNIRVMNDKNTKEMGVGQEGILVADGPNIMMGYWKDPLDTKRVLASEGYITGDTGYVDKDGFFYVTGRKDGQIKVSGHRVNPLEIEDAMMETGLLVEVAVIGLPDKLQGNRLIGLVVTIDDSVEPKIVLKKIATELPKHKVPSEIITVRSLPKNANGKIDQKKCVQQVLKMLDQNKPVSKALN